LFRQADAEQFRIGRQLLAVVFAAARPVLGGGDQFFV